MTLHTTKAVLADARRLVRRLAFAVAVSPPNKARRIERHAEAVRTLIAEAEAELQTKTEDSR